MQRVRDHETSRSETSRPSCPVKSARHAPSLPFTTPEVVLSAAGIGEKDGKGKGAYITGYYLVEVHTPLHSILVVGWCHVAPFGGWVGSELGVQKLHVRD